MRVVRARGKINLYLRVGPRRPDGYHDIQTIFHSIDLADELWIEEAPGLEVTCSDAEVPDGPENLSYRAAAALRAAAGVKAGASIVIEKRIPAQAGLGGGSADAAATLRGLNELWNTGLSIEELERIGAGLGADVPFCIRGGAAYAEGIGERLTPLPALPPAWLVLARPDTSISTREAYAALDAAPDREAPSIDGALAAIEEGIAARVGAHLFNDFERVALAQYPEVGRVHSRLRARCPAALLAGSGSAVFGLAAGEGEARAIAEEMAAEGWWSAAAQLAPAA